MNTNQDILQSQWPEIKGQVKQQWGNLTDDDVRQLSGTTRLVNALQQRYGYGKVQAEIEIDQWVSDTHRARQQFKKIMSANQQIMKPPLINAQKRSPRNSQVMRPQRLRPAIPWRNTTVGVGADARFINNWIYDN